jgi:hypothetical protein
LIQTVPDTWIELTYVMVTECNLLEGIPDTLTRIELLTCIQCCLWKKLPPELLHIHTCQLYNLPLLTHLPVFSSQLCQLTCQLCPWLPQNSLFYPQRQPAVRRIQNWFRRGRKQTFRRYLRTRAFNEWFYDPSRAGGKTHKKTLLVELQMGRTGLLRRQNLPI